MKLSLYRDNCNLIAVKDGVSEYVANPLVVSTINSDTLSSIIHRVNSYDDLMSTLRQIAALHTSAELCGLNPTTCLDEIAEIAKSAIIANT